MALLHRRPLPPLKLGKLEPKHDRRTLRLANYLPADYTPPTSHWDLKMPLNGWGMMKNDQIGDCTCATVGHMVQAWTSNDGPAAITLSDAQIEAAYSAVTGIEGAAYNPVTGENDNGAYCLDVLNYWRKEGVGGHRIVAYMKIDPSNRDEIRAAIHGFGGCYLGVSLPESAGHQWAVHKPWTAPLCRFCPSSYPGSWGGHAVPLVAYTSKQLWCATWGTTQRMSWAFLARYCDEAYAVLSADWTGDDLKAPNGFDFDRLRADLARIAG